VSNLIDIKFSTYPAWHRWDPAAWLRVSGPDAFSFLQGQNTQDLRPLRDGAAAAVYGLWLTVKGKVVGDSFVLRGGAPDEFWVGSYFTPAATLLARLEAFLIADEVTLEDQTAAWTGLSLLAAANDGPAAGPDAFRFTGRRVAAGNVEWVGRRQVAAALLPPPGRELDAAQMKLLRLDAGIPAIPEEFGPADLPQEAGLEGVAVSFQKGCYLGQEVMARLKAMGQVRRQLWRVAGEGALAPAPGTPLRGAEDRLAGEVRSVAADGRGGWIGLAMISLLHAPPEGRLLLPGDTQPSVRRRPAL
jgi:folate-binding protein YgfZ